MKKSQISFLSNDSRNSQSVALNVGVIVIGIICYRFKKFSTSKMAALDGANKREKSLKATAEKCWRNVILFSFVTYPATNLKIFQILPSACHNICTNLDIDGYCNEYLKADYSVHCNETKHKFFLPIAYLLLIYPIAFPVVVFALLKKYRPSSKTDDNGSGSEIYRGLSFIYENYVDKCWFWELVETGRKIVFTLIVVYADTESQTYLAVLMVVNGLYGVLFASWKPIEDQFEYWLQIVSIMGVLANMFVGMMIKIPKDEMSSSATNVLDSIFLSGMVLFANTLVILVVAVRYIFEFKEFIQDLRSKRKFSWEFCWAACQMLLNVHGDVSNLVQESKTSGGMHRRQIDKSNAVAVPTKLEQVESLEDDECDGDGEATMQETEK